MGTVVVALVLLAVVALIVRGIVKDRKSGKGSCGHACGACPLEGRCHKHQ